MSPERHRRIGELFNSALNLDPSRRAEFLQQACAGDDELRREVESLLESDDNVGSLLATPALEITAQALAVSKAQGASLIGHSIGDYQVLSLLGSGGMGEVYCARDTRLGRDVALKVLTKTVAADSEYRLRF